jgi:hypothetical protein
VLELLPEAALSRLRAHHLARRRRHDVDDELPALARLKLDRERRPASLHTRGRARQDDLRRRIAGGISEHELTRPGVPTGLGERRQRRRVQRSPNEKSYALTVNVREVRADLERDLEDTGSGPSLRSDAVRIASP